MHQCIVNKEFLFYKNMTIKIALNKIIWPGIRAIRDFSIFVSSKLVYEANFPTCVLALCMQQKIRTVEPRNSVLQNNGKTRISRQFLNDQIFTF